MWKRLFGTPLVCFYCQERTSLPRHKDDQDTAQNWACFSCGSRNLMNANGEMLDGADPAMFDDTRNSQSSCEPLMKDHTGGISLLKSTGHIPSSLPSMATDSPLCKVCIANLSRVRQLLANYIPDETDPNAEYYERTFPSYKRDVEARFPYPCDQCNKSVDSRIALSNRRVASHILRKRMQDISTGDDTIIAIPTRFGWAWWYLRIVLLYTLHALSLFALLSVTVYGHVLELPEPLKLSHRLVHSLSDVIDVCSVSFSQSCSLQALSLLASPITLSVGAFFLAYTDPVANIRQYTRVKPLGVYTNFQLWIWLMRPCIFYLFPVRAAYTHSVFPTSPGSPPYPEWMRGVAVVVFSIYIGLLWKSYASLDVQWLPKLQPVRMGKSFEPSSPSLPRADPKTRADIHHSPPPLSQDGSASSRSPPRPPPPLPLAHEAETLIEGLGLHERLPPRPVPTSFSAGVASHKARHLRQDRGVPRSFSSGARIGGQEDPGRAWRGRRDQLDTTHGYRGRQGLSSESEDEEDGAGSGRRGWASGAKAGSKHFLAGGWHGEEGSRNFEAGRRYQTDDNPLRAARFAPSNETLGIEDLFAEQLRVKDGEAELVLKARADDLQTAQSRQWALSAALTLLPLLSANDQTVSPDLVVLIGLPVYMLCWSWMITCCMGVWQRRIGIAHVVVLTAAWILRTALLLLLLLPYTDVFKWVKDETISQLRAWHPTVEFATVIGAALGQAASLAMAT